MVGARVISCWVVSECAIAGQELSESPSSVLSFIGTNFGTPVVVGATTRQTQFHSLSCTAALNCATTGFEQPVSDYLPTINVETNGVWRQFITPSTSRAGPAFFSVSCWAAGNCVADGELAAGPVYVFNQNGVPGDSIPLGTSDTLDSVSCVAAFACTSRGDLANYVGFLGLNMAPMLSLGATLAKGTVAQSYSQPVSLIGGLGPFTYSVTSSSLPSGLTLNTSTGVISGTPQVAGTATFTVSVTDANNPGRSANSSFTLVADPISSGTTVTPSTTNKNVASVAATGINMTPFEGIALGLALMGSLALGVKRHRRFN